MIRAKRNGPWGVHGDRNDAFGARDVICRGSLWWRGEKAHTSDHLAAFLGPLRRERATPTVRGPGVLALIHTHLIAWDARLLFVWFADDRRPCGTSAFAGCTMRTTRQSTVAHSKLKEQGKSQC